MAKKDDDDRFVKPGVYVGTVNTPNPIKSPRLSNTFFVGKKAKPPKEEDEWVERVALVVEGTMEDAPDRTPPEPPPKPFDPNNFYDIVNGKSLDKLPSKLVQFTRDISMQAPQAVYELRSKTFGRPVDYVGGYAASQDKLKCTMVCYKCKLTVDLEVSLDVVTVRGATVLDFFKDLLGEQGCINCGQDPARLVARCVYNWKVTG